MSMYQKMSYRWLAKYTKPFYWQKKGLRMLKRTLDDIDELCKKYAWLREVEGT